MVVASSPVHAGDFAWIAGYASVVEHRGESAYIHDSMSGYSSKFIAKFSSKLGNACRTKRMK